MAPSCSYHSCGGYGLNSVRELSLRDIVAVAGAVLIGIVIWVVVLKGVAAQFCAASRAPFMRVT